MPLVYLGTGWFIGIWAASALNLPLEVLLLLGLIAFIGFALWRDSRRAKLMWLGVLFAALGGGRYLLSVPHFDHTSLSTYNNTGEVAIEGVIVAEPDVRDTYINLRLNADRITLPDQQTYSINGLLLTRPSRPNDLRYGDRVRVSGELVAPPEFYTFSYKDFLARQGIYSMIDRPRLSVLAHDQGSPILAAIFGFRVRARDVIAQILPEPSASLLTGILPGDDAGLPIDVQNEFRSTGTTHIIAISGQIPETSDGQVPTDFRSQAKLVWSNIVAQLEAADMSVVNLVKVTTFLSSREYTSLNSQIRREILDSHSPALTVIITGIYDEQWLLEIETIAAA